PVSSFKEIKTDRFSGRSFVERGVSFRMSEWRWEKFAENHPSIDGENDQNDNTAKLDQFAIRRGLCDQWLRMIRQKKAVRIAVVFLPGHGAQPFTCW
ncbi:hypothetical protein KBC40_01035, partial [Patescibacteria group bacterium]|nr:hypothetical protein [Patescibacteria group bacterium]